MPQSNLLSQTEVMRELGVEMRQVQLLAKKGRLEKLYVPLGPGEKRTRGGHRGHIAYSAESVEAEKARRSNGEKSAPAPHTPYVPPVASDTALTVITAQVDAFKGLAEFLATLSEKFGPKETPLLAAPPEPEKLQQTSADFPDDAYLTLDEAAQTLRMPRGWVQAQLDGGRLPYERTGRGGMRVRRGDLRGLGARFVGRVETSGAGA